MTLIPHPPLAGVEHKHAEALGVRFHYVVYKPTGNADADLSPTVLLHGFPETWWCWHKVIRPLGDATERTVYAVDLKGYGDSDRPPASYWPSRDPRRRYDLDRLALELAALFSVLGLRRPVLVGHDWGGAVAHNLALMNPARLSSLVLINGGMQMPPPWRMWYAFTFQLPLLPETALRLLRGPFIKVLQAGELTPGAFTEDDLAVYRAALARPGAAATMLAYYRAAARRLVALGKRAALRIAIPLLIVWGDGDPALPPAVVEKLQKHNPQARLHILRGCGHFSPEGRPDEVVGAIAEFLR